MSSKSMIGRLAVAFTAVLTWSTVAHADLDEGLAAAQAGDFSTALAEIGAAAEAGNPEAQFYMGVMHDSGTGTPRDLARAAHWYGLAAEQGVAAAQYNLGLMFAQGQGLPRDLVSAYKWLEIAAQGGEAEAAAQRDLAATLMSEAMIDRAKAAAQAWLETDG